MTQSVSVKIWKDMLKQGVDKRAILRQVYQHLNSLSYIKDSTDKDKEIDNVKKFAKLVEKELI